MVFISGCFFVNSSERPSASIHRFVSASRHTARAIGDKTRKTKRTSSNTHTREGKEHWVETCLLSIFTISVRLTTAPCYSSHESSYTRSNIDRISPITKSMTLPWPRGVANVTKSTRFDALNDFSKFNNGDGRYLTLIDDASYCFRSIPNPRDRTMIIDSYKKKLHDVAYGRRFHRVRGSKRHELD